MPVKKETTKKVSKTKKTPAVKKAVAVKKTVAVKKAPVVKSNAYAIVQLQGKQYKVTEGMEISVAKLDKVAGDKLEISDVLLLVNGEEAQIGTPVLEKAKVTFQVLEQYKDKKIRVATYKSKSRYRRVKGHRTQLTRLSVLKIA